MKKLRVFSIDNSGNRSEVFGDSIVIELPDDKSIELFLKPHENHFGGVPIITPARSSCSDNDSNHYIFNIKPGASNVFHLHIEKIEKS